MRTVDGEITAIEALLRWDHPERGLIAPTTIIPLAEQSDLIVEIGRWVLERACIDRNRLQRVARNGDLQLCVNVSPHQLLGDDFCSTVAGRAHATGTDPRR